MGASSSVKARAESKVAKRLKRLEKLETTQVSKPSQPKPKDRQDTYKTGRLSLHTVLFYFTASDAVNCPHSGPLRFLSWRDLFVIPQLNRSFYESMGGSINSSDRLWLQQLLVQYQPQRLAAFLRIMCQNPERKVLHCGHGMGSIFYFRYLDRSSIAKHYAGFIPFIEGNMSKLGIPWSMPYINFGISNKESERNHEAMNALHAKQWKKAADIMLEECFNGEGERLKHVSPLKIIDCSLEGMHAEVSYLLLFHIFRCTQFNFESVPQDYCRSHASLISKRARVIRNRWRKVIQ